MLQSEAWVFSRAILSYLLPSGSRRSSILSMQVAAHLAKHSVIGSNARQAQRVRSICRAFFDECRLAEADAERGRHPTLTANSAGDGDGGGSGSGSGSSGARGRTGSLGGDGVRARIHECAGFVAVLALLLQTFEEWERSKRFLLVSASRLRNSSIGATGGSGENAS